MSFMNLLLGRDAVYAKDSEPVELMATHVWLTILEKLWGTGEIQKGKKTDFDDCRLVTPKQDFQLDY